MPSGTEHMMRHMVQYMQHRLDQISRRGKLVGELACGGALSPPAELLKMAIGLFKILGCWAM